MIVDICNQSVILYYEECIIGNSRRARRASTINDACTIWVSTLDRSFPGRGLDHHTLAPAHFWALYSLCIMLQLLQLLVFVVGKTSVVLFCSGNTSRPACPSSSSLHHPSVTSSSDPPHANALACVWSSPWTAHFRSCPPATSSPSSPSSPQRWGS